MTTKTPPNPQNVRDMRLMLAGARLLIKHILAHENKLSEWKFVKQMCSCAYNDRESLVNLIFIDSNYLKFENGKLSKIKPSQYDDYEEEIKSIMPEWEALVKGE